MVLGVVLIRRCFIWRCRALLILFSSCRYWRHSWHFFYVPGFSSLHFFSHFLASRRLWRRCLVPL